MNSCEYCEKGTLLIQDADGDYIHGVNFHTSEKILCKAQSSIGIRHWLCTSCQPDYEYKGNAHEKSLASPLVMSHTLNDDSYTMLVCDCLCHRDRMGELVRAAWVIWVNEHPQPKPSWLAPYEDINGIEKEADRIFRSSCRAAGEIRTRPNNSNVRVPEERESLLPRRIGDSLLSNFIRWIRAIKSGAKP